MSGKRERRMREIQMQQPSSDSGKTLVDRQASKKTYRQRGKTRHVDREVEKVESSSYRDRNGGEKGLSSEEWKVCKQ